MNRTGSGVSIHLLDEDMKDRDSAGGSRHSQDEGYMEKDAARMQLECSGRAQG